MVSAYLSYDRQEVVEKKLHILAETNDLNPYLLRKYKKIFDFLDVTHSELVGKAELQFGLRLAGKNLLQDEALVVFKSIDVDKSQFIDFSEFVFFMIRLHLEKYHLRARKEHHHGNIRTSILEEYSWKGKRFHNADDFETVARPKTPARVMRIYYI